MALNECLIPRIVSSDKWGSDQTARVLSTAGQFACIMIGPESDAHAVELRPGGSTDIAERILVSVDRPYIGHIEGKGLGIYPVHEIDNVDDVSEAPDTDTHFRHRMQLQMYRSVPPFLPTKRPPSSFDFSAEDGGESSLGAFKFPPIPAMGRKKAFFNIKAGLDATGDINVVFHGITVPTYWFHDNDRMTERWTAPDDLTGSELWKVDGSEVVDVTLNTESNINSGTATDFAYQYDGRFDFYQVEVVQNAGDIEALDLRVWLED